MRLNGWQRIGIVASVCWFIGGGLWISGLVMDQETYAVREKYRRCLDARSIQPDGTIPQDTDWGPCVRAFDRDWGPAVAGHWTDTILFTLLPIPIVWLIVYGLVGLARWIKAGFTPSQQKQ
jgi:hypothetical protein